MGDNCGLLQPRRRSPTPTAPSNTCSNSMHPVGKHRYRKCWILFVRMKLVEGTALNLYGANLKQARLGWRVCHHCCANWQVGFSRQVWPIQLSTQPPVMQQSAKRNRPLKGGFVTFYKEERSSPFFSWPCMWTFALCLYFTNDDIVNNMVEWALNVLDWLDVQTVSTAGPETCFSQWTRGAAWPVRNHCLGQPTPSSGCECVW